MTNCNKRITDIIKDTDIETWTKGQPIIISAGTGAGKSYFIKNVLYKYAKERHGKILMLIHRRNCVNQFQMEIEADYKTDVITIMTYQKLENSKLFYEIEYDLSQYMYVVCDEFHYFFNDSSFNNHTDISFNMIMGNTASINIFMSATGDYMSRYINKYIKDNGLKEAIQYKIPLDFSFINQLVFFNNDTDMEKLIEKWKKTGEKGIFFIQSAEKACKLHKKYEKISVFNCSESNKNYKNVDENKIEDILKNERFEEQFLITTACFDAGVNIIDTELKNIVIDIVDIGSLIQCIGRKRIQNEDDKVNVYIKNINNNRLSGLRASMKQQVEMADVYKKNESVNDLINKFYRKNDVNNILYDENVYDESGKVIFGQYIKKVNDIVYFKKRIDIAEYTIMINFYGKFAYCKKLAKQLQFFNDNTNAYTYTLLQEENRHLEEYLKQLVDDKVVFLRQADRIELIKKINVKQDGKLLKSKNTLNEVLKEKEINYKIKEFETTRWILSKNGKKEKKKYKHAWKIVACAEGESKD